MAQTKERHREYMKERQKKKQEWREARKIKIYRFLIEYKKKTGCQRCNENDPVCLEFHHVNEKKLGIGKMAKRAYSIDTIKKEIEKCTVLCANCHKKEHREDRGIYYN